MAQPRQVSCRIVLEPRPRSPALARRFVVEVLAEAGRSGWAEASELAVSELVTNALIHARTPVEVTVTVAAEAATVWVRDWSAQLPAAGGWDQSATTGRGLALVAAVTSACGVQVRPDGKDVWFQVDDSVIGPGPGTSRGGGER